jgi:hypothetical protein
MSRTLFAISDDLNALADLLSEADGDITDEQLEAAVDKWFAELGAERDSKIDGYCALVKHFEATAAARKAEAARVDALATTDLNNAKRLKTRLHQFFMAHEIQKIETLRFKVARQNNGGALPIVIDPLLLEHPEEIPEGYRRVIFSPDMIAIADALKRGESFDWAVFGERGEHLRIR